LIVWHSSSSQSSTLSKTALISRKSDGLGEDLSLSFTVLQDLHVELLAYLKPLIYQIITLAENSLIQTLDDPPEIIANHVHQALASRGERFEASANSLTRQSVEDATETPSLGHLDDEAKVSAIKRSRLETYVDPPGDVSWWQMPLAQPDDQDEVEEESDEDDLSSTLTDQEDFELDEAMDAMDRAYDEVHEGRLWRAAEGDLEEGEGGEDDEGAGEARAALLRAQSEIIRARRHRHAMRNRAFTAMTPNSGIRVKKERARRFRLSDTVDSDFEGSSQDHESGMDGVLEEGEEEISEETSDL